jgi:hypothetical protein
MAPLCALAPWREMSFLFHAAVLAKAQRRKGRKGEPFAMTPLIFSKTISLSVLNPRYGQTKVCGANNPYFGGNN